MERNAISVAAQGWAVGNGVGGLTDGVDGETARPGGADVDEAVSLGVVDGGGVRIVRRGADTVAVDLVRARRPARAGSVRRVRRCALRLPGRTSYQTTRTDERRVSPAPPQHQTRLYALTRISLMAFLSGPTVGLPSVKCTRTKSRAVTKGREMEAKNKRTKAQKRKIMPGMWNARGMVNVSSSLLSSSSLGDLRGWGS